MPFGLDRERKKINDFLTSLEWTFSGTCIFIFVLPPCSSIVYGKYNQTLTMKVHIILPETNILLNIPGRDGLLN